MPVFQDDRVRIGRSYSSEERATFYAAFMARAMLTTPEASVSDVKRAADEAWNAYLFD